MKQLFETHVAISGFRVKRRFSSAHQNGIVPRRATPAQSRCCQNYEKIFFCFPNAPAIPRPGFDQCADAQSSNRQSRIVWRAYFFNPCR
ncbi:hypothetical protein CKA38_12690 [Ereboglobus luteus]|uniref:Uncharacterized protein n=1 Tax=Ereboglobus luteus TaxID=1796921 RepID=A0A2U8E557_9BACT|nr:hypothetical protein CKA38_12690 [Ereboglobus luteus]